MSKKDSFNNLFKQQKKIFEVYYKGLLLSEW